MGLAIFASLLGMAFSRLESIVEISGLGIRLKTRKLERALDDASEVMEELAGLKSKVTGNAIESFTGIGGLFLELKYYGIATDIAMKGVDYYAENPLPEYESRVLSMLKGLKGLLLTESKNEIINLFQRKKDTSVVKTYKKMKDHNVPANVIAEYEEMMERAGIDLKQGKL